MFVAATEVMFSVRNDGAINPDAPTLGIEEIGAAVGPAAAVGEIAAPATIAAVTASAKAAVGAEFTGLLVWGESLKPAGSAAIDSAGSAATATVSTAAFFADDAGFTAVAASSVPGAGNAAGPGTPVCGAPDSTSVMA
jgi:hypothetical protein